MMLWLKYGAMLTLASALTACGGNVSLGQREGQAAQTPEEPNGEPVDEPDSTQSERVARLDDLQFAESLAVAGDYLYMIGDRAGTSGIFRCKKASCDSTLGPLSPSIYGVSDLQVAGDRLGVVGSEGAGVAWIATFALPDLNEGRTLIEQLPRGGDIRPLFYAGFAYWSLGMDESYYRCVLPDCAKGPRKLAAVRITARASADGDLIFAPADGRILKMTRLGDGPTERLLPGTTLSTVPPEMADELPNDAEDNVDFLAAGDGMLYADVHASTCDDSCPRLIARWPVTGGQREEIIRTQGGIELLLLFGQELVWINAPGGTLTTCRVEACSATLRHFGQTASDVVVDERRLYWLEDTLGSSPSVHSVGRLPKP